MNKQEHIGIISSTSHLKHCLLSRSILCRHACGAFIIAICMGACFWYYIRAIPMLSSPSLPSSPPSPSPQSSSHLFKRNGGLKIMNPEESIEKIGLETQSITSLSINLVAGWSWFSLNVHPTNTSINSVLSILNMTGGYIKNQTAFSNYYETTSMWQGGIHDITTQTLYKIKIPNVQKLTVSGLAVELDQDISLYAGWNYLPYHRQKSENLSIALITYPFKHGDFIKSRRNGFAQYYDGITDNGIEGWYGSLKTMEPGEGYMINLKTNGTGRYNSNESCNYECCNRCGYLPVYWSCCN